MLNFDDEDRALIIGSSGGIGSAVVKLLRSQLGEERVNTVNRQEAGFNLFEPESVKRLADLYPGPYRLIFDATGGLEINKVPPEKTFKVLESENMQNHFLLNAIGPALLIKHFYKALQKNRVSIFASLSARVGSIQDNKLGGWVSYRASKAALNQVIRCAAIELQRSHPNSVCVALHPGTVKTELTKRYVSKHHYVGPDEAARNLINVIKQLGPKDSGGFFDYSGSAIPF